jgi:hypothetical protein
MQAIFDAFNDQEIACNTPARQDSGCSGTPNVAPVVTVTPGDTTAIISWKSVAGATNYQVFRTEGVKKCGQGKVRLATTTSLMFTDTGLMNGREYYYIVIPKGPNESCFGPASPCNTVIPSEVPVPTTPSPTRKPSPPPTKLPTAQPTRIPTTPSPTRKPSPPPTKLPTAQPTRTCGNGFCAIEESVTSCPVDCANRELDVLTDSTKGAPGIMFWVTADSRDIAISAFKFYTWETTSNIVQIYTRSGTHSGFEQIETGWELIFEETVQLMGDGYSLTTLNLANKAKILAGATRSFFIWIAGNANIKYEAGTSEGALIGSDNFLKFYTGAGVTSKFSGTSSDVYKPRRFSGSINYDIVSSIATASPTVKPITPKPTIAPSTKVSIAHGANAYCSHPMYLTNALCNTNIGQCSQPRFPQQSRLVHPVKIQPRLQSANLQLVHPLKLQLPPPPPPQLLRRRLQQPLLFPQRHQPNNLSRTQQSSPPMLQSANLLQEAQQRSRLLLHRLLSLH